MLKSKQVVEKLVESEKQKSTPFFSCGIYYNREHLSVSSIQHTSN